MKENKKQIVVVDDHPIVAKAVVDCIKTISLDFEVISFTKAQQALVYIVSSTVDLVILGIELDKGDGFSFYRRIQSSGFSGKLIFFTALENESYIETARRLGVDGYCTKSMPLKSLQDMVIKVLYQKHSIEKPSVQKKYKVKLSQREILVLSFLMEGYSNKYIAEKLFLSQKTISTYKHRLLKKYGVSNIIDLIRLKDNFSNSKN
ncbi:response regulator transcription factor [Vibrio mediterranei]|uniref:response regulator transcription factor n=1 Tax=Vibrio mediterranei TaxID=689 RepID=UPI001EFCEF2D|nr:response regulator transcription factor [Vibrio mediterranei]MCG9659575.1 response regulator transcription factor [Vibrio mediterranei]